MYATARYLPLGDSALVIEFGNAISFDINQKVDSMLRAILKATIQGIEEFVPTYRSLLVRYDPSRISYERLVFLARDLEKSMEKSTKDTRGKETTIPVVYGGEYGPDLSYVARFHGLTEKQVVQHHVETKYRVYMIGFVAGFPYLGEVSDGIATPRLDTPRIKVPAGSVGIAEKQTGIYPCEAPGGWRIIGRTPLKLFNPYKQPPTLLGHGDIVKFKQISEEQFGSFLENNSR